MDVRDWCITNFIHGWWVRSKALLALLEEETVPSVVRCGNDRFWFVCMKHVAETKI